MTPRQRRNHIEALGKAAMAPRKSWLGKSILLTDVQSGWIKSLLTVWGENVRGGTAPTKPCAHSCWNALRGKNWSDKALERFTAALNKARDEGFRGEMALRRARSLLWPEPLVSVIDKAMNSDDAEFVENAVLQAFDLNDPVYIVGRCYYTTRKKISDISRELRYLAPWLTDREARERVRWCLDIFRAKVFISAQRNLEEVS
ncbi:MULTISPECIES: hypothetical protein [Enterobacteriaceae]|uniref:hypothetical protein n=1 Tax=Enterobacteriaceae TaxID=543 RepID=UPI00044EFEBC|nr:MULTISPECIES: hypothetical protein [Enterobacteriaceae]CAE7600543.1 hypothetical protein AI2760V1_1778 [Enterobacter cloacae]ELC7255078.1 hypothetical protein [Enterobacter hormaechei]ELZ5061460.1 hypothetical protein [Enterobacter hormaechei]EUM33606.1 hypothetical protein L435_05325 [Enterobacter hormaechei]KJO25120.1 hypothetical protein SS01_22865 [Enterobacter hormaechei subsp. xiangfangensis]